MPFLVPSCAVKPELMPHTNVGAGGFCAGVLQVCVLAGMLHSALLPWALAVYEHRPCQWLWIDDQPDGKYLLILRYGGYAIC